MRAITLSSLGLAAAAFLACGGDDLVLPSKGEPASITIVQGDGVTGRVGEQLAEPLKIRVDDRTKLPVPNVTVVVELTGGSAEPDTVLTDELGEASSVLTLGLQVGQTAGAVRVIDPEGPEEVRAGFTIVAVPGSAHGLALVSGDNQTAAAGAALRDPLVVRVTDAADNPIPNVPITWTAEGGGGVSETSTTTDAEGLSSVMRTLGTTAGPQTTTARSDGLAGSPVVFNHTATAGNPSGVQIISGNEQIGSPGEPLPQPLVVQVVDGSGNPVVAAAVTWVVTAGSGTLDPATGTTDENGRASTTWTLGPGTGANTAQAIVSGVGTATFTATASAGDPDDIRIVSGNEQTGQAGARLANDLVVEVVDADQNRVPGVTVSWRVESGGGAVAPRTVTTAADGRASTAWTLGGSTGEPRRAPRPLSGS